MKVLHIDGVQVVKGDRAVAGITVLAPRARVLPFGSQVDDLTATPSWPHVHIEVVDPACLTGPAPDRLLADAALHAKSHPTTADND
ncbi:MAG: hypothetical protein R2706_12250 [Acidimicrobiales bacterium]